MNGLPSLLQALFNRDPQHTISASRCVIFSTYDLNRIRYKATDAELWRNTYRREFWTKDIWILPIHRRSECHWVLAVIYLQHKEVHIFDSLAGKASWHRDIQVLFTSKLFTLESSLKLWWSFSNVTEHINIYLPVDWAGKLLWVSHVDSCNRLGRKASNCTLFCCLMTPAILNTLLDEGRPIQWLQLRVVGFSMDRCCSKRLWHCWKDDWREHDAQLETHFKQSNLCSIIIISYVDVLPALVWLMTCMACAATPRGSWREAIIFSNDIASQIFEVCLACIPPSPVLCPSTSPM